MKERHKLGVTTIFLTLKTDDNYAINVRWEIEKKNWVKKSVKSQLEI